MQTNTDASVRVDFFAFKGCSGMVDHVTAGHVREILATEMAINLKVNQVLDALHKGGYAFHQSVAPEALLIHPSNRGGAHGQPP